MDRQHPHLTALLSTRVHGRAGTLTAALRVFVGVVFVFFGALKFVFAEPELAEFVRFGFPPVVAIVYLVGLLEVVAGLLLVAGLATRVAALGLAAVMAGAVLTAGMSVGGWFHLGVAPTLLVANLYLLWAGSGARAADQRLAGSRPAATAG
jgi:putative oxidoreductase